MVDCNYVVFRSHKLFTVSDSGEHWGPWYLDSLISSDSLVGFAADWMYRASNEGMVLTVSTPEEDMVIVTATTKNEDNEVEEDTYRFTMRMIYGELPKGEHRF
jgi:hypothetical protein